MNARKALVVILAFLTVSLASCGTARRFGKDLFVVVASPVIIPYGAATDGYTSAQGVRGGLEGGSATEVIAFPFAFLYHAFEHGLYTLVHAADALFCPFYGLAELHPYGPEIKPLDFYQGTFFDVPADKGPSGTDATSGEATPPGYRR